MPDRNKWRVSAILGGLVGSVTTGLALRAVLDDPIAAWMIAAGTFIVIEVAVFMAIKNPTAITSVNLLRWGAIFVGGVTLVTVLFFIIRGVYFP